MFDRLHSRNLIFIDSSKEVVLLWKLKTKIDFDFFDLFPQLLGAGGWRVKAVDLLGENSVER